MVPLSDSGPAISFILKLKRLPPGWRPVFCCVFNLDPSTEDKDHSFKARYGKIKERKAYTKERANILEY